MDRPYDGGVRASSRPPSASSTGTRTPSRARPATARRVDVPTLDWAPVTGTETYEVGLIQGRRPRSRRPRPTRPRTPARPPQAGPATGHFTWQVRGTRHGRPDHDETATRLFTLRDAPDTIDATPEPSGRHRPSTRPTCGGPPMAAPSTTGCTIADTASGNWFALSLGTDPPAEALLPGCDRHLDEVPRRGTYLWWVTAYDASGDRRSGPARSAPSRSRRSARSPASAWP